MNTEIILSPLHKKHLADEEGKSYQVYTSHFKRTQMRYNYLKDLLKDVKGTLKVIKSKESWYEYDILLEYKDHLFSIGEDWKNKLSIHNRDICQYSSYSIHNPERKTFEKENKPLRYTFFKLTTKKLLSVLEYKIKLLELLKRLANEKESTHKEIYEKDVIKLKTIAKALKTNIKEFKDSRTEQTYLYTPFGRIQTTFNYNSKTTSHDYDIDKHLEYINLVQS